MIVWPAYVINLAQNDARFASSAAQLGKQGIPFERIDAVNGWALPESEIARVYDAEANRRRARYPLVPPEIGCYLSHIDAWRRIAKGPAEGGFVFEDDFHAADDLSEVMTLLAKDRRDWDMVKLFTLNPDPKCVARRALGSAHEIVAPYRIPSCAIGYGLTRETAQQLANLAIPFCRPVDEDHKFFWESGLRVALVLARPRDGRRPAGHHRHDRGGAPGRGTRDGNLEAGAGATEPPPPASVRGASPLPPLPWSGTISGT